MVNYLMFKESNIVAVHCLAGKGRTGSLIDAALYLSGRFNTIQEANDYYLQKRAVNVTRPSQIRYLNYFMDFADNGIKNMFFQPKRITKISLSTNNKKFFKENEYMLTVSNYEKNNQKQVVLGVKGQYLENENGKFVWSKEIKEWQDLSCFDINIELSAKNMVGFKQVFRSNFNIFFLCKSFVLNKNDSDIKVKDFIPDDFELQIEFGFEDNMELVQEWTNTFKEIHDKLIETRKIMGDYYKEHQKRMF